MFAQDPRLRPHILTSLSPGLIGLLGLVFVRVVTAWSWPVPLSVDEAQYLVWSRELQFGYYSKPPFVAWALSAATLACPASVVNTTALFGPEGCVRWIQPVALGGAAAFVYLIARDLFKSVQIAVWSAVLFLLAPLTTFYSQAATTDAWLLLWWSASLWAFVRAVGTSKGPSGQVLHSASLIWWVTCGIFTGLGLLTKYSMAAFAVSALIVLLQRRLLLTPGPWLCGLVALLVFSPNLVWNAQWGWPTIAHHADITVGQDKGLHLAGFWNFFTAQWLTFSPLVFGMFLWGSLRRSGSDQCAFGPEATQAISLLLAFAWPMLLVVMTQSALSRAHANWASPALVGMSILVAVWWLSVGAKGGAKQQMVAAVGLWGTLTLNLLLSVGLLASPWLLRETGLAGHRASDPFVRLTGYKEVAKVLAQIDPMPILASDDRKLLASLAAYLPHAQVYAFNPNALKDNHWQLQRDLNLLTQTGGASVRGPVLLVQTRDAKEFGPSLDAGTNQILQEKALDDRLLDDLSAVRLEGKDDLGVRARWIRAH